MDNISPTIDTKTILGEFSKELIHPSIDMTLDYIEMGLETLVNEDLLKSLPFMSTLVGVAKVSFNVRDRALLKKTLIFLKEFHSGTINPIKFENFKHKIVNDSLYRNKVVEHTMIVLDKLTIDIRTRLLANTLIAHINGIYDWQKYTDLTQSINGMYLKDIEVLRSLYNHREPIKVSEIGNIFDTFHVKFTSIERLKSCGFLQFLGTSINEVGSPALFKAQLSEYGRSFVKNVVLK